MTQPFLYSVEREYEVDINQLWAAWVDPHALQIWYSPVELSVVPGSVTSEPRVGGAWSVAVDASKFGFNAYFWGLYTAVVEERLLEHTMLYTQDDAEFAARDLSGPSHLVRIEFEERGSASWVKFSQFGELPGGEPERAKAGMESYFDNLGSYLQR